jgi:predicted HTH domain antitoxin
MPSALQAPKQSRLTGPPVVSRSAPAYRSPAGRYTDVMHLELELPDELSAALAASGRDPSRAALEAIALEAYRERRISTAQLRRLLGFSTRYELDGFLKEHEVWLEYTARDLDQDLETHRRLDL